ncbi:MAG: hypothetical protein JNK87_05545 [Bryobacterales bacterium]|nr:hypothetical protein [Bryobacterales bacterium]
MKAVEFEATVGRDGQIIVPQHVVNDLPPEEPVRVVMLWDVSSTDSVWREAGRRTFEQAYGPEDIIYEQLVANEAPDR